MPDISQLSKSNYLKRADVQRPMLVTIKDVVQEQMKDEHGQPESKWVIYFLEQERGMVLNKTNAELIALFTKERNTDNWTGHKVVLYDDPTISFGGKLVGGIRVRAPRQPAAPQPPPQQPVHDPLEEYPEDCPF